MIKGMFIQIIKDSLMYSVDIWKEGTKYAIYRNDDKKW